jgi:hypothetical protein
MAEFTTCSLSPAERTRRAAPQAQPNFAQAIAAGNIIYLIPTPLFGAGLVENIPEATIYQNLWPTRHRRPA